MYSETCLSNTYFRYVLISITDQSKGKHSERLLRTNDKVDLRTKVEGQILVAHELMHFDGFNDTMVSDSLTRSSSKRQGGASKGHTPETLRRASRSCNTRAL